MCYNTTSGLKETDINRSYLKGSQHAAGYQYEQPEVHVEELWDLVSHKHWENQEKQTHADATEVFPQAPRSTYEAEINEKGENLFIHFTHFLSFS